MTRCLTLLLTLDQLTKKLALQVLELLMERQDLSEALALSTMQALVDGAGVAQISAFLVLLRAKVGG